MPVPSSLSSLSTTAASNSPSGGENPFPDLDNILRAHASFIAQLRDGKLDATAVSAFILTLLDDANAAAARTTLGAVGLTGSETVEGVKTFSSSPIAPTPTTGDNTTKTATTAFVKTAADAAASAVDAKVPGVGQTWQDVKASRSSGAQYTNSTNRPITVSACAYGATNAAIYATVDGVVMYGSDASAAGRGASITFIVPPGSTYSVTMPSVIAWLGFAELR